MGKKTKSAQAAVPKKSEAVGLPVPPADGKKQPGAFSGKNLVETNQLFHRAGDEKEKLKAKGAQQKRAADQDPNQLAKAEAPKKEKERRTDKQEVKDKDKEVADNKEPKTREEFLQRLQSDPEYFASVMLKMEEENKASKTAKPVKKKTQDDDDEDDGTDARVTEALNKYLALNRFPATKAIMKYVRKEVGVSKSYTTSNRDMIRDRFRAIRGKLIRSIAKNVASWEQPEKDAFDVKKVTPSPPRPRLSRDLLVALVLPVCSARWPRPASSGPRSWTMWTGR